MRYERRIELDREECAQMYAGDVAAVLREAGYDMRLPIVKYHRFDLDRIGFYQETEE